MVPIPVEVELSHAPDWNASSNALVAEYHLKVPNWASTTGTRILLPAVLFGAGERHPFEGTARTNPIYFAYPYSDVDDVTITTPAG